MTGNRNLFEGKMNCNGETPVIIPNDDYVPVEGKGTPTLPNRIKIVEVLYIPKFECNILFVSCWTKDLHCYVMFFPNFILLHMTYRRGA